MRGSDIESLRGVKVHKASKTLQRTHLKEVQICLSELHTEKRSRMHRNVMGTECKDKPPLLVNDRATKLS